MHSQLTELQAELTYSNQKAYAEGSKANLKIQWESFLLFCTYFKFCAIPAKTLTLQLYAQFLSRSFRSVSSIKNYVSGVKTLHLMVGAPTEQFNDFLLNLSFQGLSKLKQHLVKKAAIITPDILLGIYASMDFSNHDNYAFWCLFIFAYFLLARKSNLVPTTAQDLQNPKFLLSGDVRHFNSGLLVSFHWSKTLQYGDRVLKFPLSNLFGSKLCPVSAYINMINHIPRDSTSPLFILKSGKVIFYHLYMSKLRFYLSQLGLDPSKYSTHSFRRGMATLIGVDFSLSPNIVQMLGDWKSDCYKEYLEFSLKEKVKISEHISEKILDLERNNSVYI